jgi:RecA-family ATPase
VEAVKITKVKCIQCGEWLVPSERRCSRCGVDQIEAEEHAIFSDLVRAYERTGDARDWFAEGAIEGSPLTVIVAPEKWGKSWTLMDLAVSAVTGSRWLGTFEVKRTGEAWYVDCEYGEHEFARRIARIARAKGFEPCDVLAQIRHVWGDFQLSTENGLCRRSFELAKRTQPNLVVIDPWRNVLVGSENSAEDTIEGMRVAAIFREHAGCPVVLCHHLNLAGSPSGSRALKGRADLYIAGTDEEQPWFTTVGRTIRQSDPIAKRFTIHIEHEHDLDEKVASRRSHSPR